MKPSLSVFLPVRNAQASLSPLVAHLLEVLPDLTPQCELVVIDDGSHDATWEIARELGLLYPQVFVVAHPGRWGRAASMRSGLLHSSGQIVLYRSEGCRLGLGCIWPLWQAVRTGELAVARPAAELFMSAGRAVTQGSGRAEGERPGAAVEPDFAMIRRRALDAWRRDGEGDDWLGWLMDQGYRCLSVAGQPVRPAAGEGHAPPRHGTPIETQGGVEAGPRGPNYLSRLNAFALGE